MAGKFDTRESSIKSAEICHKSALTPEFSYPGHTQHSDLVPPGYSPPQQYLEDNCSLFSDYPLLSDALPKTFSLLDKNKDGKLTKEELASSFEDNRLTPIEGGLLAAFYDMYDELSGLSKTFWGESRLNSDAINKLLKIIHDSEPPLKAARDFRSWTWTKEPLELGLDFKKGFKEDALNKVDANKLKTATEKENLKYLRTNFAVISKDGFCQSDTVDDYFYNFKRKTNDYFMAFYVEESLEMARVLAADKPSQNTYWHASKPLEDVQPKNVVQGHAGDCVFKSALISILSSRPANVVKMINRNSDHSYTVTFPNTKPIHVKEPTWAEQVLYEPFQHSGQWQNVLEKAYGSIAARTDNRGDLERLPVEEKIKAMWRPDMAIGFLTGHKTKIYNFYKVNEVEALKEMRLAFARKTKPIVIAGTDECKDPRLNAHHSYTVEKIIGEAGSGKEMVVIRNPLGHNNDVESPELSLPSRRFWENFQIVAIEQTK